MSGVPETAARLRQVIEQAVGPVRVLRDWWQPGDWILEGLYRGQRIRYFVHSRKGYVTSLSYGCELGQRPIALALGRPRVMVAHLPVVPLGDPSFEQQLTVHGWPAGVVQQIVNPAVREWLLALPSSSISTDEGCLTIYQELREGRLSTTIRVPAPAEIREWTERAMALTGNAIAAFEQARAAVAAEGGQAEADRWVLHHAELMNGREAASCRTLLILLAVSFLVVIVMVLLFVFFWVVPRAR